jgi:hypothetical protein
LGGDPLFRKARISGGVLSSFPWQRGQNPPADLRSSAAKSEGLLPLSVEMITHLPWMGSFLSWGTLFLYVKKGIKKGNFSSA